MGGFAYDGVIMTPDYAGGAEISMFKYKPPLANTDSVEATEAGNKYHVIFHKVEEGKVVIDEQFETILIDPGVYVDGLVGLNLYVTIARKTAKTGKWIKQYLKDIEKTIILHQQSKQEKK